MELGVHPTTIIQGYNLASHKSKEILTSIAVNCTDEQLRKMHKQRLQEKVWNFQEKN